MGALLIALLPVMAVLGGPALNTALAGLTVAQWGAIAAAIANLLVNSSQIAEVEKHLSGLHPAFGNLFNDVRNHGPQQAAAKAYEMALRAEWPA